MHRLRLFVLLSIALANVHTFVASAGPSDPAEEVAALYERFVTAQNERDLAAVHALLLPSADFQWVSDGRSYWGPDALVERMSVFQKAEIWEVVPDRARRRFVPVSADAGYLYQPLVLRIGARARPDEIPFLVNVLAVRRPDGWRIAALFTTTEKP